MHMASSARSWTADEVRAIPDDTRRYEVIDGELLVTPAPRLEHQRVLGGLYTALRSYLHAHPLGEAIFSPADVAYGERTMVQPDLFVAPLGARDWSDLGGLLLVIEVLSRGTARRDRFTKRRLYQREGVPEYWIVDLDARAIERWTPGDERPEILDTRITWHPAGAQEAMHIELDSIFRRIKGD